MEPAGCPKLGFRLIVEKNMFLTVSKVLHLKLILYYMVTNWNLSKNFKKKTVKKVLRGL